MTSTSKRTRGEEGDLGDIQFTMPPEILEHINHKSDLLKPQLEQAHQSLEKINQALAARAESFAATDYSRTAEILRIKTSVINVINITLGTLRNLKGYAAPGEDLLGNRFTAIMASGALKDQIDKIIADLKSKPDTSDINLTTLQTISAAIHDVTKDIANFTLTEHDD